MRIEKVSKLDLRRDFTGIIAVDGYCEGGIEVVLQGVLSRAAKTPTWAYIITQGPEKGELSEQYHQQAIRHSLPPNVFLQEDLEREKARAGSNSARVAMELLTDKWADGVLSVGKTDEVVKWSVAVLKCFTGLQRPALIGCHPSRHGLVVAGDIGAVAEADETRLVHVGILCKLYAKLLLGIQQPRIGIITNGTEDDKGTSTTRAALAALRTLFGNELVSHSESETLYQREHEVVITDGTDGNIIIKLVKGLSHYLPGHIGAIAKKPRHAAPLTVATLLTVYILWKQPYEMSLLLAVLAVTLYKIAKETKYSLSSRARGAELILGVNGVVAKGRSNSDSESVEVGLRRVQEAIEGEVILAIKEAFEQLTKKPEAT